MRKQSLSILIVGAGGREHALTWKISQSKHVKEIWVAPGNAGTATEAKTKNISITSNDIETLLDFAQQKAIDLTIVGPEAPLCAGIVDVFTQHGLVIFGPNQKGAQLEASKTFAKKFMQQHNIPTASYQTFTKTQPALNYVRSQNKFPLVIKADGLASGKGVIIAASLAEAEKAIDFLLTKGSLGQAGSKLVIEEFLVGEELSYIALVDGQHILPLASSQDHKRRNDGDQGPNTGGMGAYSPASCLTPELEKHILEQIMYPTVAGLTTMGINYRGFLYAGLMLTTAGPQVLEFNCRLGDPEAQAILVRLKSDLIELCQATLEQTLNQQQVQWDPRPALGVVMADQSYPQKYVTGEIITGLGDFPNTKIFHGATVQNRHQLLTAGGRVLCVTSLGDNLTEAKKWAYQGTKSINWPNCHYRRDIGHNALKKATSKS